MMRKGETIDQWLKREQQERFDAESIKCPHCGDYYYRPGGDTECLQHLVTYYGAEDGPVEIECDVCEKTFWVEERVERTYDVTAEKES